MNDTILQCVRGCFLPQARLQYTPDVTRLNIQKVSLNGVEADYIYDAPGAPVKETASKVGKTARKYSNEPTLELKVNKVEVRESQLGYVNRAAKPPYRVFLSDTTLAIENFSNHLEDGVARGKAQRNSWEADRL